MSGDDAPLLQTVAVSKYFGSVVAVEDVSLELRAGEVVCLLGDNGAGKSTLIKILSGVHRPDSGHVAIDGKPVRLGSPRDAQQMGIATVYQDLAILPLMSITRNFFVGHEPTVGRGPLRRIDMRTADRIAKDRLARIGIHVSNAGQPAGTLSGGEQQSLSIARAEFVGARIFILDEPTSALGVKEAAIVLRHILQARQRGVGVILITHNVHHALPVGDRFVILNRGRVTGTFNRGEVSAERLTELMSGAAELEAIVPELELAT